MGRVGPAGGVGAVGVLPAEGVIVVPPLPEVAGGRRLPLLRGGEARVVRRCSRMVASPPEAGGVVLRVGEGVGIIRVWQAEDLEVGGEDGVGERWRLAGAGAAAGAPGGERGAGGAPGGLAPGKGCRGRRRGMLLCWVVVAVLLLLASLVVLLGRGGVERRPGQAEAGLYARGWDGGKGNGPRETGEMREI